VALVGQQTLLVLQYIMLEAGLVQVEVSVQLVEALAVAVRAMVRVLAVQVQQILEAVEVVGVVVAIQARAVRE